MNVRTILTRVKRKAEIVRISVQSALPGDTSSEICFPIPPNMRSGNFLAHALTRKHTIRIDPSDLNQLYFMLPYVDILRSVRVRPGGERSSARMQVVHATKTSAEDLARASGLITLSHDFFAPLLELALDNGDPRPDEIVMPYFCHPTIYSSGLICEMDKIRAAAPVKTRRICFCGSRHARYRETFDRSTFRMLDRVTIIDTLLKNFEREIELVTNHEQMKALHASTKPIVLVITDSQADTLEKHLLPLPKYVELTANSWFALTPPGLVMPHSHNLVEAMAVGTIPLLNYPKFMTPPLQPDIDCRAFSTEGQLVESVTRILEEKDTSVFGHLRTNVVSYYDRHLSPEVFADKIVSAAADKNIVVRVNDEHESMDLYRQQARQMAGVR